MIKPKHHLTLRDAPFSLLVIEPARKAVACAPDDSHPLSDLGWTLLEAGHFAEVRTVLQKAIARAPAGYAMPKNNLIELEKRMRYVVNVPIQV